MIVEKPMVMNAKEAKDLIATRDSTGRLLVVAFQGSLSPEVRTAVEMLNSGELGEIRNISGLIWQNWKVSQEGKWRENPTVSGGGFLFDSGAHMLNTISDLAGEEFSHISAFFKILVGGNLRPRTLTHSRVIWSFDRNCYRKRLQRM